MRYSQRGVSPMFAHAFAPLSTTFPIGHLPSSSLLSPSFRDGTDPLFGGQGRRAGGCPLTEHLRFGGTA